MKARVPGVMTIREKRAVYLLFMAGDSMENAARKVGGFKWWGTVDAEQAFRDIASGKLKTPKWTQPKQREIRELPKKKASRKK